jgi:hypothetical protein
LAIQLLGVSYQENVPGIGTTAGPSWTAHDGNSVWLAWKGSGTDTSIWVSSAPSLQPNSSGEYAFTPQAKVLALGTTASPAIASLNGTLYLFYKGESDNYIYWATMASGSSTWVDQHKLVLGNSAVPQNNNHTPETSTGPTVVAANNCLYLFYKGANDNSVRWTVTSGGENPGLWAFETVVNAPNGNPLTTVSPAVAVQGQTIHLVIKGQSDGNLYWMTYSTPVNPDDNNLDLVTNGAWSAQTQIFSGVSAYAPALVCDGNGAIWLAWTGSNGGVSFANIQHGYWIGPFPRLGIGSSDRPALISTGNDNTFIMMAWKGQPGDGGIYYGTMIGPQVAAPGGGLTDASNYWIYSNCNPITGLTVTIEVTQAIVYESTSRGTSKGFSFQLNAFSKVASNIIPGWQQFIYNINTANSPATDFNGQFETWPGQTTIIDGKPTSTINGIPTDGSDLINLVADVHTLQTTGVNGIPAGYTIAISLGTDSGSNVNSATFSVTAPNLNGGQPYTDTITPINPNPPPINQLDSSLPAALQGPITEADLAPILAFQLVLVGPDGCAVNLSSGAGTITYTASSPLTALNSPPSCINNVTTGESANSSYGTLPQGTSGSFVQTFQVSS